MIYALVSDLFFADTVMRVARSVNEPVVTFTDVQALCRAVYQGPVPDMALVELPLWDPALGECLQGVSHVAGYGPHVAQEQFRAARTQGVSPLWANSALVQKLGPWIESCRPAQP